MLWIYKVPHLCLLWLIGIVCRQNPRREREMELVEMKVWGVTSLQAAEHETKPSSTSYVFLKESVYS